MLRDKSSQKVNEPLEELIGPGMEPVKVEQAGLVALTSSGFTAAEIRLSDDFAPVLHKGSNKSVTRSFASSCPFTSELVLLIVCVKPNNSSISDSGFRSDVVEVLLFLDMLFSLTIESPWRAPKTSEETCTP